MPALFIIQYFFNDNRYSGKQCQNRKQNSLQPLDYNVKIRYNGVLESE